MHVVAHPGAEGLFALGGLLGLDRLYATHLASSTESMRANKVSSRSGLLYAAMGGLFVVLVAASRRSV